jgi:hypothetical protein
MRRQALNLAAIVLGACGLRRAVEQLHEDDRRNAETVGLFVEAFAELWRAISKDSNTKIGVQHIAEH